MSRLGLLPQQPEKPLPEDCCGNGCDPCVLDVYQELLLKWENDCRGVIEPNSRIGAPVLSVTKYMPFQLVSIRKLTKDTNTYRFQAVVTGPSQTKLVEGELGCLPGQYLMLRSSSSGQQGKSGPSESTVTRAYTPISFALHGQGVFEVMIKIYSKGKMSAFVKELKVGDVTFWRGPYGSFRYERNSFRCILMLGAGTGVAPLYAIAESIVNDEQDDSFINFMFACKSVRDILLRDEIRSLCSFWNFRAEIYLSNDDNGTARYGENLKFSRIGKEQVESRIRGLEKEKCLVLICGPTTFTESMGNSVKLCGVPVENIHTF